MLTFGNPPSLCVIGAMATVIDAGRQMGSARVLVWDMRAKHLVLVAVLMLAALALSRIVLPFDRLGLDFPDCADVDPRLPRVLLIGDSTQIRYFASVRRALRGQANVCRVAELAPQRAHSLFYGGPLLQPVNAGTTDKGVARLGNWLGDERWTLIHFNWGLHELGPPEYARHYGRNLDRLVDRLDATGAVLMIATTTPVPTAIGYPPGAVERLNAQARAIAARRDLLVDDLHAAVQPRQAKLQPSNDIHFNDVGVELLARAVTTRIRKALKLSGDRGETELPTALAYPAATSPQTPSLRDANAR